jgi:hypothetical protein
MMSKSTGILILILLLISGCAFIPETQTEANSTASAPQQEPTIAPSAVPGVQLPDTDQIIFTIPNPEVFSGREGEPRPNWLGWGAETFSIAPDGSVWIADTAVDPYRLIHLNFQGRILQEISLQTTVGFPYHLVATQDALWILEVYSEQPRIVRLNTEGKILSSVDIPRVVMTDDGQFVSNGVSNLLFGEHNELLLNGVNGWYELLNASGEVTARPLEALFYYGHTYKTGYYDEVTGNIPVFLDGAPLETRTDFIVGGYPFLGVNPDGSFALAGYEHAQNDENWADELIMYYGSSGKLLGIARQRPQTFYKDAYHHLAFGPDGSVYQLLSNPDHSVQLLRLGFSAELPPVNAPPILTPTPLTALKPSKSAVTDEEQARNTLLAFFDNLSGKNYAEAVPHFGGEAGEYAREPMSGETLDAYWEYVCGTVLWCLPVADITSTEQVSENEFIFHVVFMYPDGARFEISACCGGDPAATPPVWQFAYPVQKSNGVWRVMREPLFTP